MSIMAGLSGVEMALGAFRWAGKHIMPWIACFLAGVIWHSKQVAEKEIAALEAEKQQVIVDLAELRGQRVGEAARDRRNEAIRQQEWEGLQDVFRRQEPVIVAERCMPDERERERVRRQAEAVNGYLAGIVSRRAGGGAGEKSEAETTRHSPD